MRIREQSGKEIIDLKGMKVGYLEDSGGCKVVAYEAGQEGNIRVLGYYHTKQDAELVMSSIRASYEQDVGYIGEESSDVIVHCMPPAGGWEGELLHGEE